MTYDLDGSIERDKADTRSSSDRTFGLLFFAVFLALGGYFFSKATYLPAALSFSASILFLVLSIVAPGVLAPLNRVWTRLGLILHKIVNPVILSLVFLMVIVPTGLCMRLFRRDALSLRLDPQAESYWVHREPGPSRESMKQQF